MPPGLLKGASLMHGFINISWRRIGGIPPGWARAGQAG
jgi:hypothetical protein